MLIPLLIAVVKAAQTTNADDEERPAQRGIVPSINTFIPEQNLSIHEPSSFPILSLPFNCTPGCLSRIP